MNAAPARRSLAAVLGAVLLLVGGCAATRLEAQWRDPQSSGVSLGGLRLLVACEGSDVTLRQLCEQRVADELQGSGAATVPASSVPALAAIGAPGADAYLAAARAAGAAGLVVVQLAAADVQRGSPVSLGIGGFSIGGSGGIGVGVNVPVGGTAQQVGYQASGRVVQASDGRLLWTARALAAPSGDAGAQVSELARVLLDAARRTGVL